MRNYRAFIAIVLLAAAGGCSGNRFYYNDPPLEFSNIAYPFTTDTATVNGTEICFHDSKTGSIPIVLIHGLASNMGFFRYNIPELERSGFRVIAIDLPGYGRSSKPYGAPYSLKYFSETVTGLMRHLGLSSAVIVGHSMGGQIALLTALRSPAAVRQLVLLSPAGFEAFKDGEGAWLRNAVNPTDVKKTTEDRVRANLTANFYSWNDKWEWMVEERERMSRAAEFDRFCYAVSKSVRAMIDEPMWDRLKRIAVPALIIAGENDNLIPNPYLHGGKTVDVMEYGRTQMPHAALRMMPHAGHMVQMEACDDVNAAITEFCRAAK